VRGAGTANERSHGLALAREMMRYVVSGTGVLTYSAAIVGAFVLLLVYRLIVRNRA